MIDSRKVSEATPVAEEHQRTAVAQMTFHNLFNTFGLALRHEYRPLGSGPCVTL